MRELTAEDSVTYRENWTASHIRALSSRLAALPLAAILLCALPSLAQAQTQVSDEFIRVTKELGKRVTSEALARICDEVEQVDARPICKAIVKAIAPLFEMAIDRKVDEQALSRLLVDLESSLAQSAAAHAAEGLLRESLQAAIGEVQGGHPECVSSLANEAPALSQCLIAQVLPSRVAEADAKCRRVADEIVVMGQACGLPLPAFPSGGTVDVAAILDAFHKAIQAVPDTHPGGSGRYRALVALTQVERLLENRSELGSMYSAVARATDAYETAFDFVGDVNREHVTVESRIKADLDAIARTQCDHAAATERLARWQSERARVFHGLATSLVAARVPDKATLDAIPTDIPAVKCPEGDALTQADRDAQAAVSRVRRSAVAYRNDVLLVSRVDALVIPALLGASLIDYLRTTDARTLDANLRDVALRVLARMLAGIDARGYHCAGGAPYTCTSVDGPSVRKIRLPTATSDQDAVIQSVFEARYSPASARQTCLYQAVAAILQQPIAGTGICRLTGSLTSMDLSRASFSRLLRVLPGTEDQLAQWDVSTIVPLANGRSKLSLLAKFDADEAYSLLGAAIDEALTALTRSEDVGMPTDAGLLRDARAVVTFTQHLLERRQTDGTRAMLTVAANDLRPLLDKLLDDFLGTKLDCADGEDATSLQCGTRILVGAVYAPVVEYIAIPNPTETDRQRLASEAYRKVLELDVLSRTPVLFNVGLGFSSLSRGGTTTHLTLLDKIGIVARWGRRNEWEAGGFIGGFLDAIVRAATNSADVGPYWMVGGTIGRRSLLSWLPLGLEAHAGVALPFEPAKFDDRAAFAMGLALIVPADILFGK